MLKHITPADPAASIPDLAHGRILPATGLDLELTPYWIGLAGRGDVVIADARGGDPSTILPDASQISGAGYLLRINGVERLFSLLDLQAILSPLLGPGTVTPPDADAGFLDLSQPLTTNSLGAL
ncbi:hypothetical protein MKK70_22100 [Methylobacterium sp. E-041]|uniref:hypothetical protein n=1 Tax=Methylobacterium sp. E-041 TaxID=2836573 RepID=UPI001FBB8044|nr:hypothetical protein [Methylobacterium sp. E-041]MCJ2108016.1 hypothetical protein [Methylobacterium sp. E-041]